MKRKSKLLSIPLVLLALVSITTVIYYIVALSKYEYHSDFTDTIMWAEAALKAGKVFNPGFDYAALLPFGGHLIMIPFVFFFGVSLKAHILGMVTFTILFVSGIIFLGRSMKWRMPCIAFMVFNTLLILTLSQKLREIYWGHIIYYSLGIIFMLFGFALVFYTINILDNYEKKDLSKFTVLIALSGIWFLLCSTNLMQSLIIFVIPALASIFLFRFFETDIPLFSKNNLAYGKYLLILLFNAIIGVFLGLFITVNLTGGYAEAYSTFSNPNDWLSNLEQFLTHWTSLLGVTAYDGLSFSSVNGVINLIKIMFSLTLFILPVIMIKSYQKLPKYQKILLIYHWIMTTLVFIGYVFGRLAAANWRLSPIVASAVIVSVSYIVYLMSEQKLQRFGYILATFFVVVSLYSAQATIKIDKKQNERLFSVTNFLKQEGLTYGYATFWNANVITVFSDSEVKSRCIEFNNKDVVTCNYQSNKEWYQDQAGQDTYFLLLTKSEYDILDSPYFTSPLVISAIEILEHENYVILVFDVNIMNLPNEENEPQSLI